MDEYNNLQAYLEDLEDLYVIRKAKEDDTDVPSFSSSEVERELGLE